MRKTRLILAIILILSLSLLTSFAVAEEADGLEVTLMTDKTEYKAGETIVATLAVTNNYAVDIALIQMENLVPQNCQLAVASKAKQTVEDLASGATAVLVTHFTAPASVVLPQTGDAAHPLMWVVLAATALAGMTWLFVCKRKVFFCLFAVLMIGALLAGGLPLARADAVNSNVTTVSTTVMLDGMPLVISAEVIEGAGKNIYKAPDPDHIQDSVESIGQYVDNQLLLVAKEDVTQEQIEALIASHNGTVVGCLYLTDDFQIEFPEAYTEAHLEEIAAKWMESGLLIRADINAVYSVSVNSEIIPSLTTSTDPLNTEWALEAIHAKGAWQYQDQFTYPNIGIIDSGFDINHEDLLRLNIRPLENLESNTFQSSDEYHGTHVLGIMAANPNNKKGITGMALNPNVYAYPISDGKLDLAECKSILELMITARCKVINVSWGNNPDVGKLSSKEYYAKVQKASKKDGESFDTFFTELIGEGYDQFLIVQSAGNRDINAALNCFFVACEAAKDHILVVSNANVTVGGDDYFLASPAAYGPRVDVVAPGCKIMSTVPGNRYSDLDANGNDMSGTSMAAPFVSGTAALCFAVNPSLSGSQVKEIIVDTAEAIVVDDWPGESPFFSRDEVPDRTYKMINAQAAVERAGGITTVTTLTGRFVDGLGQEVSTSDLFSIECYSADQSEYITTYYVGSNFTIGLDNKSSGSYYLIIKTDDDSIVKELPVTIRAGQNHDLGDIVIPSFTVDPNCDHVDDYGYALYGEVLDTWQEYLYNSTTDHVVFEYDKYICSACGSEATWCSEWYDDHHFDADGYCKECLRDIDGKEEELTIIDSGTVENNIRWTIYSSGLLEITGNGCIPDYVFPVSVDAPWRKWEDYVTEITIGNGITQLGNYAFAGLHKVISVQIPDTVTSLGGGVFVNCKSLLTCNVPDSVQTMSWDIFFNCESITSIKLSRNVKLIDTYTFNNCSSLEHIEIPASVTRLASNCFEECNMLKTVVFLGSAPSINNPSFSSNTTLYYDPATSGWSTPTWNGFKCYPISELPNI